MYIKDESLWCTTETNVVCQLHFNNLKYPPFSNNIYIKERIIVDIRKHLYQNDNENTKY